MKRGDVVTIAFGSGSGTKPRPAIVVQSDSYDGLSTTFVAPTTSDFEEATLLRPLVEPSDENGLRKASVVMVSRTSSIPCSKVGKVIGRVTRDDMARIDVALATVLGLT